MDNMRIKGVIFDADGTLLDSMYFWNNTVFDILKEFGITPDDDIIKILTPMSMFEGAVYLKNKYDFSISPEEFVEKENRIVEKFYSSSVNLKHGVLDIIKMLKANSIPMTVASATDKHLIEKALIHNEIIDYFNAIVSCSDVGEGKSSPAVLHKARSFLNTDISETAVVEDSPDALCTAKNAGYITVGIFDKTHSSDLHKEICDIWFPTEFDINVFARYV